MGDIPNPPSWAEQARTVVASGSSASVHWDGGRVDLLGCHRDGPLGEVTLTVEPGGVLARAVAADPGGDLPVTVEFAEVCPVAVRHRIRSRVRLDGWLATSRPGTFRLDVSGVLLERDGEAHQIWPGDYRRAAPDPLHPIAAQHLQHLDAQHPETVALLSRLCDRSALSGALRVVPIGLDRAGLLLRVERLHGHTDVRLGFRCCVASNAGLAAELTHLIARARWRRPCHRA